MGLLISSVLLVVLQWGLKVLLLGGAVLCLLGVTLHLRRFWVARSGEVSGGSRRTTPWAAHVLGGIGIALLAPASAALTIGEWLGVFGT